MGKSKQVKKFGAVKRMLNPNDPRLKANQKVEQAKKAAETEQKQKKRKIDAPASSLFFAHNEALGPPYRVIVDTNFINFSLQNKIELVQGMMDCLYAESE